MSAGAVAASFVAGPASWSTYVTGLAPTAWWRLGESSGTTAADASGNGRTGTYVNSPTLSATGATADGNTAVTFDGVNDQCNATVGHSAVWPKPNQDWSVSMFLKFTTTGVFVPFAIRANDGSTAQVTTLQMVTGRTAGRISAETWDAANSASTATSTGTVNDGNFHHVAVTFNNTSRALKLYVDGTLHSTKTQGGVYNTNDRWAVVGYYPDGSTGAVYFPGTVDEVIIKAGVEWTSTQVSDLYAARLVA